MPLLLSRADLRPLVTDARYLGGAFERVEAAVLYHQAGESGSAAFLRMPLVGGDRDAYTVYATSGPHGGGLRVFPFVGSAMGAGNQHLMLLMDSATGALVALLAGDDLNELRTSVPAGVGARYLAPAGAKTLCILGSGRQARSHARTLRHALPDLEQIVVWSPTSAHREQFAAEMGAALGMHVVASADQQAAVESADVITATGL